MLVMFNKAALSAFQFPAANVVTLLQVLGMIPVWMHCMAPSHSCRLICLLASPLGFTPLQTASLLSPIH